MTQQALNPGLPTGATNVPVGTQITQGQLIGSTSGQLTGLKLQFLLHWQVHTTAAQQVLHRQLKCNPATSASSVRLHKLKPHNGVSATATQAHKSYLPNNLAQLRFTSCTRSGCTGTRCAYSLTNDIRSNDFWCCC